MRRWAADVTTVLMCLTCRGPVVFADGAWMHLDPDSGCGRLIVAWPPPLQGDDPDA
jgi:hypothetical protein